VQPFNIKTDDIGDYARRVLERHGIDPATATTTEYTIYDHLRDSVNAALAVIAPPRFVEASTNEPEVLDWIRQYVDTGKAPDLMLRGPVGSGKTHTSIAVLRQVGLALAEQGRRVSLGRTSHPDFNQSMRPSPDGAHLRTLESLQEVDLLAFDDFGAGKSTDWTEDTLYRLIDTRWSRQLPTIVTTNMDAKEFRTSQDERIVSRLAGSMQVALTGGDRRRSA
jgi:DNA replication protein DnaC